MKTGFPFITPVLMITVSMALGLPVLANAAMTQDSDRATRVRYDAEALGTGGSAHVLDSAEALYERLKYESRRICGSSNIRQTGSVERSVANDECYEGTLSDAVERVNDSALTALHGN